MDVISEVKSGGGLAGTRVSFRAGKSCSGSDRNPGFGFPPKIGFKWTPYLEDDGEVAAAAEVRH